MLFWQIPWGMGENARNAVQFKQQMHDGSMQVQHQKHWHTFKIDNIWLCKSNENHQLNFEPFCGLLTINICNMHWWQSIIIIEMQLNPIELQ